MSSHLSCLVLAVYSTNPLAVEGSLEGNIFGNWSTTGPTETLNFRSDSVFLAPRLPYVIIETNVQLASLSCTKMKTFILGFVAAVASVQATTLSLPYSLEGNWATDVAPASEIKPPVPGFAGCYTQFTSNVTSAVWSQYCRLPGSAEEVLVGTLDLSVPTVVACGQNQQLGTSFGVLGGFFTTNGDNTTAPVPVCVNFNRVDGDHVNKNENSQVAFVAFQPEACPEFPGKVCCPAGLPTGDAFIFPTTQFNMTGMYKCQSGVCNNVKWSSYCEDSSNYRVKQIGVGMSVGGIGLLLVTLAMILVISNVVQG